MFLNTLISATTLLMSTIAPLSDSYTIIEDRSDIALLNPDLKKRETLKLRLQNGLQVLIISDPGADQSAASVAVGSGSWNDPLEYAGMAHFCEHMLFMGTEKYPNENTFFTDVGNYAGITNAFTAPNRTVYMFSAQTNGFLSLLDQFAQFFISPLFNPNNIAREMHAVDQEFAKNIEHDGWREYMIFKETGNQEHPNRLFSTGNSETLKKIPQSALKTWHKQHYSADKMHLVIYSALPVETLRQSAVEMFGPVPVHAHSATDTSGPLSSPLQVKNITFIKPIQNRQTLTLSWELPKELAIDPSKSAELIAYALQRGQEHSLYENLKTEQLIDTMSVRVDDLGGPQHRFFQISLELTAIGIEAIDLVVERCFSAIATLKNTGIPLYLFQEKNAMAKLDYQYQERQDPFSYISQLGDSVAEEELSTYPRNLLLSTELKPDKIKASLQLLTPQTLAISLMAPPEVTKVQPDRKEKWLGAEYAIRPIPEKWMNAWTLAKPNEQIRLAGPNPFIPSNLKIAQAGPEVPVMIANNDLGIAYYVRSPEFQGPDAVYAIHILTPEIGENAKSAVLASLYIDHLTDVLHPTLAAASEAGLNFGMGFDRAELRLQLSGYSEKAPLLLQQIAKEMPLNPPTREQFAIYVDRQGKGFLNFQKELAARQAKELLDSLINQGKATRKAKLEALRAITYEDFLKFHKSLFEKTYIKALFAGNLTMKEAESAWLDVIHVLAKSPFPKEEHAKTKILRLSQEAGPLLVNQTTDSQGNASILLVDQGHFTYKRRAAQEVLGSTLKEAFFSELRTKQKTGYIVQTETSEIEERLFQSFIVQSNSHQPDDLLFRFEQFIEEFNDSLAENIPIERFETLKESLIASLQNRFRNLKDKTALWDSLAFQREGDFAFIENRINGLEELSYEEFQDISHSFLSRGNRKRLAVLFEGRLTSPYSYSPITPTEIHEVASYEPRPSINSSKR
jgi:insulysin